MVDADFGKSPGGHDQVAIRFELVKGPNVGQTFTWWGYFNSEDNTERAVKVMATCGYDGNSVRSMISTRREVDVVLGPEERQDGKGSRTRVRFVNAVRDIVAKPLDADAKTKLQTKLAKLAERKGIVLGGSGASSSSNDDEPDVDEHGNPF